jgi:hypothetical protein
LDAKQPYLQPQARPRTGAQGGAAAALVAMGAGAPGIEGLSLGTKRIEEARTKSMGGSPRAEDDGSGRNPRSKVATRARSCRRRLRGGGGGFGAALQGAARRVAAQACRARGGARRRRQPPIYGGARAGGSAVLVSWPGTPWPWRRARMGFGGPGCWAGADRVGRLERAKMWAGWKALIG